MEKNDINFLLAKYAKLAGYSKGANESYVEYTQDVKGEDYEYLKGIIKESRIYTKNNCKGADLSDESHICYEVPNLFDLFKWVIEKYEIEFEFKSVLDNKKMKYRFIINKSSGTSVSLVDDDIEKLYKELIIQILIDNVKI